MQVDVGWSEQDLFASFFFLSFPSPSISLPRWVAQGALLARIWKLAASLFHLPRPMSLPLLDFY